MTILNRFTNNSVKTLVDAATIVLDAEDAPHYQVTITANRTLGNPSNPAFAKEMWIAVSQDAVGGHTLAFASDWVAIDPNVTLNPTPNTISVLHATSRNFGSGIKWYYSIDANTTTGASGGSFSVVKMADLSTLPGQTGDTVTVLGFYVAGDGGGGQFYWVANGVATPVVGMVVNATGGQWVRLYDKLALSTKWFGSIGDASSHLLNTKFSTFAQAKAVYPSIAKRVRGTVRFPAGVDAYVLEGLPVDAGHMDVDGTTFIPEKRFYTIAMTLVSGGFIDVVVEGVGEDSSYVFPVGKLVKAQLTAQGTWLQNGLTDNYGTVHTGGTTQESDAAVLARYEVDEAAIQTAINYMQSTSTAVPGTGVGSVRKVVIPAGYYMIKNMLKLGSLSYGPDTNAVALEGIGHQEAYGYSTVLYWTNPTEIDAILNVRGFDSTVSGLGFYTASGCTSFAGILLKNGVPTDRDSSHFGAFTSRITIKGCGFGNSTDNIATTRSQRGIGFDSHWPTDGNIEQCTFERCSFSNCFLAFDFRAAQPYTTVVRDCSFGCRGDASGYPYGICFYSYIQGGIAPYDMEVYGCEFQRQWVCKHVNTRSTRFYGNSTENCKRFYVSLPFTHEVSGGSLEFRGMRWNLSATDAAFKVWEPSYNNPRVFNNTITYETLTDPLQTPPYWCHFSKGETVNISGCSMEAARFEPAGDYRQQGIIARNNNVTITSIGNHYASRRPFILDDGGSWGQSPGQDNFSCNGGVTSLGDSVTADSTNQKQSLAPMFNTENPGGTVVISDAATSAWVNWENDGAAGHPVGEQVTHPHDRHAIWDAAIIGLPQFGIIHSRGFLETTDYKVDLAVQSHTGTPPVGAYQPYLLYKDGARFQIGLAAAPGAGNSVTVSYQHRKSF